MSIQSFNSTGLYENTSPNFYDFIIVDEFHHAEAPSYQKLLDYYRPRILLGLNATPERMDGRGRWEEGSGFAATYTWRSRQKSIY